MAQGIFNLKQVNQAIRQGAWSAFNPPQFVEYLVVAGAGGGGATRTSYAAAGGGGAGGLLSGILSVTAGATLTVTVGGGGAAGIAGSTLAANGDNSVFGSITSTGGGGGAERRDRPVGNSGGSGGGSCVDTPGSPSNGGSGIFGQGNAGGASGSGTAAAGGGGGAGTIGLSNTDYSKPANGGAGIASSINGTVTTYAGGGGAGRTGVGGVGGGGTSGNDAGTLPTAGTVNTGGGGGAGSYPGVGESGAAGGSGIVIVRYPGNVVFYTGGTVNYNNGYISHIFNATGTLAPTAPAAYNTSYQISRSLRFNNPTDTAYLNRTPATTTNRRTFTFSAWVKLGTQLSGGNYYRTLFGNGYAVDYMLFMHVDTFSILSQNQTDYNLETTQVFRDSSAWYHLVIAFDTTQATSSNRIKMYVNGVQVTAFSTSTYPSQNYDTGFNTNTTQYIGWNEYNYYNGHMTEVNFIDGQQLTPSSFGATSTTTGVWAPIKYTGSYGTNGFYLNFSDNSNTTAATLGKDYSGNGNNWTPNNFSVTAGVGNDSMVDSPTQYGFDTGVGGSVRGNYCTLNPLIYRYGYPTITTFSNGNLDALMTSAAVGSYIFGSIFVSSGKWYWETTVNAIGNVGGGTGIDDGSKAYDLATGCYYYYSNGSKASSASLIAYGASYTTGDIIGTAFDADAGTLTFYKNGVSQGVAFTGITGQRGYLGIGENGFSMSANFGQRPFAYTAPSGFKALCTQNLLTPAIGGTSETLASKFFSPVLWTGDGTNPRNITGVGFQPDLVWIKGRAAQGHYLQDAVRGVTSTDTRSLSTHSTAAETNYYASNGMMNAFISDGFTTAGGTTNDNANGSGNNYVAWNWRAGNNAGSTNTSGSITSTVSASPASGFSIVSFNSTSATGTATIGHGLGAVPSMIIMKNRAYYNWEIYHISSTSTSGRLVFTTSEKLTDANPWNQSAQPVTSSIFGYDQTWNNGSNDNIIAYCFAPIAGYSAFGSYTGNGSADGPFVYTGFRPAFIMIKRYDTGSSADWQIIDVKRDTYNTSGLLLQPNAANAESDARPVLDILSNGFKNRNTYNVTNVSSGTYIYMAFAESPFKYSLAK